MHFIKMNETLREIKIKANKLFCWSAIRRSCLIDCISLCSCKYPTTQRHKPGFYYKNEVSVSNILQHLQVNKYINNNNKVIFPPSLLFILVLKKYLVNMIRQEKRGLYFKTEEIKFPYFQVTWLAIENPRNLLIHVARTGM
jgi:hypothetical protein